MDTEYPWLMLGDCLERMKEIPDGSVDMILCDLPYGTTACKWDVVIPFEPLWEQYWRVLKPSGAAVLFGHEIFTANLILSQQDKYRYSLVWKKSKVGRFPQAKLRFLNEHEDIVVFSKGKCSKNSLIKMNFYPQGLKPFNKVLKDTGWKNRLRENRNQLPDYVQEYTGYPKSILDFPSVSKTIHPTQKPVPLLEYLVKTYTNEGEIVLDNTMGSGSTGVACVNTNRKFIGIEKDEKYFGIAQGRIQMAIDEKSQLLFSDVS
jgi:site-specific DNA-methyltransferase (adenine-specific)